MPSGAPIGKLYRMFTLFCPNLARRALRLAGQGVSRTMVAIAAMMFVALFGWGQDYFHWSDPSGRVQLALFTSFILGIICGYKTRG
jgi:hypothetical protein